MWRCLALLGLVIVLILAFAAWRQPARPQPHPELGLFTSLPVMWAEEDGLAAHLTEGQQPTWLRAMLERRYLLRPRDILLDLRGLRFLLLAQPRPLDPAENVALDHWVRGGGRLLLFADPMLTAPSRFPIGDRRRPQDVVLLSPILTHWGLDLAFDEGQPQGLREIPGSGLRVDLAGRLSLRNGAVGADCRIERAGLVAQCRIGRGRALVVADAALLDGRESSAWREVALQTLLDEAFGPVGQ